MTPSTTHCGFGVPFWKCLPLASNRSRHCEAARPESFAVVPKGTQADRKAYLGAAVQAAMKDQELIAEYKKAGVYFDSKLTNPATMLQNLNEYATKEKEFYQKTGRLK